MNKKQLFIELIIYLLVLNSIVLLFDFKDFKSFLYIFLYTGIFTLLMCYQTIKLVYIEHHKKIIKVNNERINFLNNDIVYYQKLVVKIVESDDKRGDANEDGKHDILWHISIIIQYFSFIVFKMLNFANE